jgi:ATP-dependent Lhr-like helicase
VLLIAPTGGGKTLAGFLPSLVELSAPAVVPSGERKKLFSLGRTVRREGGLHTLYISPLKALAVDIARNLETPIAEMNCRSASKRAPAIRRHQSASASAAIRRKSC